MALQEQDFGQARGLAPENRTDLAAGPPLAVRAGFGRRLAAYLLDAVIVGVATSLVSFGVQGVGNDGVFVGVQALLMLATIAYYVYFWHTSGTTPGKQALGLRVVNARGESLTVGQAIIRYVGYIVSALPLFLGFFWALRQERRGWHDLIADTYVIKQ